MKTPHMTAWVSGLKGGTISGAEENGRKHEKDNGKFRFGRILGGIPKRHSNERVKSAMEL